MRANPNIVRSILIIALTIAFSISYGTCYSFPDKKTDSSCISPQSKFAGNNIGYGMINNGSLNKEILDDADFHNSMIDPENSNLFGGLFYSVKRYLETGDESFKPLVILQTLGGGADIAGAMMQGLYILHALGSNQEISKIFSDKFNIAISSEEIVAKKIVDFTYIGCPEKRLSHEGVYKTEGYKAKAVHQAFVDGSLDVNAGLMPEDIEDSRKIEVAGFNGESKKLNLIHSVTSEMRFVKHTTNPETLEDIAVEGVPIEDNLMTPIVEQSLGMDINLLALHKTVGEAADELKEFIHHKLNHTRDGKKIKFGKGRSSRPGFILASDTGGDSFSQRDSKSTKNMIISPVNEGYNILVLAQVLNSSHDFELCVNFTPFAWGTDGESNASVINDTINKLYENQAINGVVYRIPPEIIQNILMNVFGLTNGNKPILQSHANVKALKLLWKASVFFDLGIRQPVNSSLEEFIANLKPLKDIGQMSRDDVPVIDVETIIAGDREGGAHELMMFLNGTKAIKYFMQINDLDTKNIKNMTYLDLRRFLEEKHLVTAENELPSYSEYELMKACVLRNPAFNIYALEEQRADYLIPRDSNGKRFKSHECLGEPNLKDSLKALNIYRSGVFKSLRNDLVKKYLRDYIDNKSLVTGFLRMNSRYIMEYFRVDFPKIYHAMKKNPDMVTKISDIIYEEFTDGLVDAIEDAKRNSHDPHFFENLSENIINENPLISFDHKIAAAALNVLRINPKSNKFIFYNLQLLDLPQMPVIHRIAKLERKIIQGFINNSINEYLMKNEKDSEFIATPFDLNKIEDKDVLRVALIFQNHVKKLGTQSGKYEKLFKSFSNLILYSLATSELETLYKAITIFYYIIPENLNKVPGNEIFNNNSDLNPFIEIREALYSVRKNIRGEGFIKLLNGMIFKQLIQFQHMGKANVNIRNYRLISGLFMSTSNPEHTSFFQEPVESFLNPEILKGIIEIFSRRMDANRKEIQNLQTLKMELVRSMEDDINALQSGNNMLKALNDIMENNSELLKEFYEMLREGLLAGSSTMEHIDRKIKALDSAQSKWVNDFACLWPLIPFSLRENILDRSA